MTMIHSCVCSGGASSSSCVAMTPTNASSDNLRVWQFSASSKRVWMSSVIDTGPELPTPGTGAGSEDPTKYRGTDNVGEGRGPISIEGAESCGAGDST